MLTYLHTLLHILHSFSIMFSRYAIIISANNDQLTEKYLKKIHRKALTNK